MKIILILGILIANIFANMLQNLDKQRIDIKEGSMQVSVVSTDNRGKITSKQYNILRKDNANSLVIFAHKSEKGSLVVKENNNLFIKTGRSKRAVKISPIQRLVGDVSIGDILEIRLEDDYTIDKQENGIIFLKAIDKKRTYATIKVYVTKKNKLIKSQLFSYSGKMLKTLFYEYTNDSNKINKYRFISRKGESISIINNYNKQTLPNRLFKKRNIANLYQNSKKYFK